MTNPSSAESRQKAMNKETGLQGFKIENFEEINERIKL